MVAPGTQVYFGIGSNLGDREDLVARAVHELATVGNLIACSSLYETQPWGLTAQPPFINCCCLCWSSLAPLSVLRAIQKIEHDLGRRPSVRWGPRCIDVDLLLYGNTVIAAPELSVPHPRLTERAFVLVPLAEIAPDVIVPLQRRSVRALLDDLGETNEVRKFGPAAWRGQA